MPRRFIMALVVPMVLTGHGRQHPGIQLAREMGGVKSAIGGGMHLHLAHHAEEAQMRSRLGLICANGRRNKLSSTVIGI